MKYTNDPKKIAANIRAERCRLYLKQEEVANKVGISRASYLEFERDATKLRVGTLLKIADALGCDIDIFYMP